MAWRWEKEDNGEYCIVVDGWEKGIGTDPYSGLGRMLGVNLEIPGEVSVGYGLTTSVTSGATLGKPIASSTRLFPTYATSVGIPTGAAQSYAILDATGNVFEATTITGTWTALTNGATTTGASDKDGIAYWLGRLWKFRNQSIDYWTGTVWVNGWNPTTGAPTGTPLNAGVKHFAYVATNNELYVTNGNTLARISSAAPSSFDPTAPLTYSFSSSILSLPVTDIALSLAEVGGGNASQSTLLVGGAQNAIYPWDKISSSFSLPIYVADAYIGKMISVNQNAFIFPGATGGQGRIYITNGSQADLYYKVPDFMFNSVNVPYYEWGGVAFHRNEILFGLFPSTNGANTPITLKNYLYALNLQTKKFRVISTLTAGSANDNFASVIIPATNPNSAGFSIIVGQYGTGSTNLISYSATTAGIGSGSVDTDLMPVGTFTRKQTFSQVEYKLRSPLEAGENITMSMDTDTASQALTFNPTPTTGTMSGYASVSVQAAQWLRFAVSMTGNSATSGVRLKEIRLR